MLSNNECIRHMSAPGSVTIRRSAEVPTVICIKDGHGAGTVTVDSGVNSMAFGNILFGGIIGADADAYTEVGIDYPTSMQMIMGSDIRIEKEEAEEG